MNRQTYCYVLMGLLMILLLTGCWDRVEIEDRGFVVGAALDLPEDSAQSKKVKLTNQFVVPSGIGAPSQGSSGGQPAHANVAATGKSLLAIEREMGAMTSRSPYLPNMKLISLSSELAKTDMFESVLDLFIRDHEMRRGVKVAITEGNAAGIFNIDAKNAKLPVNHIESVMNNHFKYLGNIRPLRVGGLHEYLLKKESFLVPKITKQGNDMTYQGAGVFHGYNNRMTGVMNVKATKGYNLLTGQAHSGTIKIKMDDSPVTLELMEVTSSMKVRSQAQSAIKASIQTDVESRVAETFASQSLQNEKRLQTMGKKAEKKMEKLMKTTIKKAQNEWKADILGVGRKLHKYHYDVWQTVKKDWDRGQNYFSEADIDVASDITIKTTGVTDQSKK
ncbi:Ger(x)C family spore germination protein [Lentibacillus halophilus]|uniref:Ger(X)C family spore germination protein n=1 Tax=Lentibacillus halophilus TaxID=295065 RepID=A0ABN0Z2P7_9BACI